MSDPKKLQVKGKAGEPARHGTDNAGAILRPFLAMGPVRRCYAILLLALCTAFGPLCTDMYLPALPDIAKDLNVSTAFAQASITACLLGLALGQLFMGPVSDGRGRRGPLIFSLALFTVSSGLCSVMQDGYSFLALRFCMGLGGAGGIVLARAICCDSYQGSALTRFMSLLMAIHSVGPILGPVIGGIVAGAAGWRAVFWLLTVIGVFLTVSCFFILPETLAPRDRVPGGVAASFKNAGRLFRQSAFLCYCGQQGFTMGGFFAYISSSPFIFQKIYGFSVEGFSFIFGINAIGI
ncbi:MAG: multidrug effflux MFS transporter, partial [Desulfovibrio sp.]|nr:multidrug effflux MFS transporter [Desulfovibrio sp.]